MNHKALIITAGLAAGGLHIAGLFVEKGRGPHMLRPMLGTFLFIGVMLLIGEWWPEGAGGLAGVVLLTALVMNGDKLFKIINQLVK